MSTVLEEAVAHHRAGRLEDAERLYLRVLQADPAAADAWQFLGLIALNRGDVASGVEHIRRAIALNPGAGIYHFNLGIALRRHGDVAGAIASYRQAVKLAPGLAEAHNNLGNCLYETGDFEAAATAFRRLVALRPTSADAHVNLSKALLALGRPDAAEKTVRRALSLEGHRPFAEFQLGNILQLSGRYAEAEVAYRAALDGDPPVDGVRVNLGNVLVALGDYEGAGRFYREAIASNPDDVQAHLGFILTRLHLRRCEDAIAAVAAAPAGGPEHARAFAEIFLHIGHEFQSRGRNQDAVHWLSRAVEYDPKFALAQFNLGLALQHQGRLNDAVARYAAALESEPASIEARKNVAILHLVMGRAGDAIETYRDGVAIHPEVSDFQRFLVAATFYDPAWSNERRYVEARRFGKLYGRGPATRPDHRNVRQPDRRLRIGYLSSDFRDHPVGRNLEPLLLHRDRGRFEVFVYSEERQSDGMTGHLRALTDVWRTTTGQKDEDVATQIRADGVDILVALASHLDDNRPLVCRFRPAPIQVSFHDVTTSGLDSVDYLIADRVVCPAGGGERFTERVIRLPSIYAHQPIADAPDIDEPPCRSAGFVTFGCLNNPSKLNGSTLGLWGRVMQAVPRSRLRLKFRRWFESPDLQMRIIRALSAVGVAPERLDFSGADQQMTEHLETYNHIDIALDTFPFAGSTTTFEALWMGVPVVTLMGHNMMSRWSGSILKAVGLEQLVAETPDRFVATAAALAGDPDRLADLRAALRGRVLQSSLVNGRLRARQIERTYRVLWRRWCAAEGGGAMRAR